MTIAAFSIHPAPYRDPLFACLAETAKGLGCEYEVFFYNSCDGGHSYWNLHAPEYPHRVMRAFLGAKRASLQFHFASLKVVFSRQYYLISFPGVMHLTSTIGIILCLLQGRRYAIEMDSVEDSSSRARLFLKSVFLKHATYVLVPGTCSADYIRRRYNLSGSRVIVGMYLLDATRLRTEIDRYRSENTGRSKRGIPVEKKVFLMVANMEPHRMYPLLLSAFEAVVVEHPESLFVMVGKGPDYQEVACRAKDNPEHFLAINGCSFEEMKELYAIADVYVHGGKEPYSTALVIGAIAGLPLISSREIGAVWDVLEDGISGFEVTHYENRDSWVHAIKNCWLRYLEWKRIGRNAYEKATCRSLTDTARSICLAAVPNARGDHAFGVREESTGPSGD